VVKRHRRGAKPGRYGDVFVIRRIFHITFQFIGVLAVGFAIALIAFFWRLSSGPLSIAYFTPYFESALSNEFGKLKIKINDTILTWAGVGRTLEIRLIGAQALGANQKVIAEIPELSVSLSAAALLEGRLAPRTLSITGPSLKIIRNPNGQLDFGFGGESGASNDLARTVVAGLLERSKGVRAIDYLTRLNILGAHLTIDDRRLGFIWDAPNANIVLRRTERGLTGETDLALRIGEMSAAFRINADYDAAAKLLALDVAFADFNPSLLAGVSKKAELLRLANFSANGTASLVTGLDGGLKSARFDITAGPGIIGAGPAAALSLRVKAGRLTGRYDHAEELLSIDNLTLDLGENGQIELPAPISHVMPLTKISLKGRYSKSVDRLDVESIAIDTPGPRIRGSAVLQEIGNELSIAMDLTGDGLDAAKGELYWPAKMAPLARQWIVENFTAGTIGDARIRLNAGWSKQKGFQIVSLAGDLKARGLSIDYFSPLPKIIEGDAYAKFDQKQFDITVTSGRIKDTIIKSGHIMFTGLDQFDQFADIEVHTAGPLSQVIDMLDGEPLDFARKFNLRPVAAKGRVSTQLNLKFLVERAMTADTIEVKAVSRLQDISVPGAAFGFDLTEGNLALRLDNRGMEVDGEASLAGIRTEFHWREKFEKADIQTRYRVKAMLAEQDWTEKLGLTIPDAVREWVQGPIAADLEISINDRGEGRLDGRLGLTDAVLTLAKFDWTKAAGTEASAEFIAAFTKQRFHNISEFTIAGGGLDAIGSANFNAAGGVREIRIEQFQLNHTDIAAVLIPVKGRLEIDVRGRVLDLRGFLAQDDAAANGEAERGQPLSLSFSLGKALVENGLALNNVTGAAVFDGLVWRNAQFSGTMKKARKIELKITPDGNKRHFLLTSNDAGQALKVLDFNENVVGGSLRIDATYRGMMPDSPLQGILSVDNFRVLNAPVFAQLLSIASLTGILEALGGKGLQFNQLIVPFVSGPDQVRVEDARATGITLGITATGSVDTINETIDLRGTLIPAYLINSALGRLPIVGPLFSGGQKGGGVFAAEFRVKGNVDKPDVSTNPLTALAPGFLRNIFKVFERKEDAGGGQKNKAKKRPEN
jgi:hypothetical protein